MSDTNDLMNFISASLGTTLDEVYQRLIDCNFGLKDPELAMFTVALLDAMGRENRGDHPTVVVLMLAFGETGTAERSRNRLMRCRRGEMSGHDLAREPGFLSTASLRIKKSRNWPAPSRSVDLPSAAPPSKKVRMNEIKIQRRKLVKLSKKVSQFLSLFSRVSLVSAVCILISFILTFFDGDWEELCAKIHECKEKAKDSDEWKRKYDELQIAFKKDEIKHLKELYKARVSKLSLDVRCCGDDEPRYDDQD